MDSSTVVIVVRVRAGATEKTAGVVVDAVSEVYSVAPEDIRRTPDLGASPDDACVRGLTTVDAKMVMLLDIDRLVAACIGAPDGAAAA
jgi:purine-binding chemotaxis protein CheW